MSLIAISSIGHLAPTEMAPLKPLASIMQSTSATDRNIFLDKLTGVDASIRTADTKILNYISGQDVPIHDVLMSLNGVKSELTLMVQIRNKVLEAYQEIARLQI